MPIKKNSHIDRDYEEHLRKYWEKQGEGMREKKEEEEKVEDDVSKEIEKKCDELKDFLVEKNRKYGNSALETLGIFTDEEKEESEFIRLSIDHKLKRLKSDQLDDDEDVLRDLVGYMILLMIAEDKRFK